MKAALANGAWLAASVPAWLRFRRALHETEKAQGEILHRLLTRNAETAYGRAHGFGKIRSAAKFRERVPVVDCDDLAPWIARHMRGEQGVLTREPVTRLVPTSGSTGGRKLIPFTAAFQRELNAAIGPWMIDLCRAHPAVPFGPAYWSVSPAIRASAGENSAVPIGFDDDSAYLGGWKQRLAQATFAVPSALRHVGETDDFRYLTLLSLLRQPELRLVSVWHPSFLTLLLDGLRDSWDEWVGDVGKGGCGRAARLPPEIRRAVDAPPMPHRAHELRQCGPDVRALWPRLRVVSCWGDGQAALAAADLQRRLPHAVIQSKGLLATEAFVSIPFGGRHPLAVTSHFFEFENGRAGVRLAHELEAGETYAVIVTTAGGLWRYRLGDLVEVDGFAGTAPSLRFLGRGAGVSDLCGEKLAEIFVTRAIAAACESCGCAPRFAMLAPETNAAGSWGYTLFAEGEMPPGLPVRLDTELRQNPHYALCRDLGQLGPLRLFQVTDGYEIFCKAGTAAGRRLGDIKPQALSTRPDWRGHFAPGL